MSELLDELQGDNCLNYGKYVQQSHACSLCMSKKHNEVNLLRVKKHMTFGDMADTLKVSEKLIRTHFENHFIPNQATQRILSLNENTSSEARDIIMNIMEGNFDFHTGLDLVMKSRAERLVDVKNRMKEMREARESYKSDDDEDDTVAFCKLSKVADDLEKALIETYRMYKQEMFPMDQAQINNALLSFKLTILQSMIDRILTVFIEYENSHPDSEKMIMDLRRGLALSFDVLESEVVKSGAKLLPNNAIETEASVEDEENN